MNISYANAHIWTKAISSDTFGSFGKNASARLRATLRKIEMYPIHSEIRPLDDAFLQKFIPLYERHIQTRRHPVIFDIREKTLGKTDRKYPYLSLSLYEGDTFIGGTIFSLRKQTLAIAYRAYDHDWKDAGLQANPSLYTEYYLEDYARSVGMQKIIHGKDRNPYGINSNIGLAIFKLSVGCRPRKSKRFEVMSLETDNLKEDAFILEYPTDENEEFIRKAYLVVTKESEATWLQTTKYPEQLEVTVIYRNTP